MMTSLQGINNFVVFEPISSKDSGSIILLEDKKLYLKGKVISLPDMVRDGSLTVPVKINVGEIFLYNKKAPVVEVDENGEKVSMIDYRDIFGVYKGEVN